MKISNRIVLPVFSAVCLTIGLAPRAAKADVMWQHQGKVSLGKQELLSLTMNNAWSGDNHKTTIQVDASKVSSMASEISAGAPSKFQLSIVERLGDDRLLAYSPQAKMYVEEPYSTLKSRLRFNLWEGIDEELAKAETIPELTPEQRKRLGSELRASLGIVAKKVTRTYFRAIPQKRTINGLEAQGYRFTTKVNIATDRKKQEWVSFAAEAWIAPQSDNDSEIAAFTRRANAVRSAGGPATVSMWSNEMFPVLWEAAPREFHSFFKSILGDKDTADFGFAGTPVQFFATITPPPAEAMATGSVRFSLELTKRETTPVGTKIFQAPEGYKQQPLEPLLQIIRNAQKQSMGMFDKIMDGEFPM